MLLWLNKDLAVTRTLVIDVKPDVVWHGLTDQEAISDWKVGNTLIFQGEYEGKSYQDNGNILAAYPGKNYLKVKGCPSGRGP